MLKKIMCRAGWHVRRCIHILIESVPAFGATEGQLRASALTYYSLFAIVPIFALVFGVAKGFGLEAWLKQELLLRLQEHQEILRWLYNFADTTLRETKGGLIAGVGLLILFWTVVKMIGNIESAFNRVWQVEKSRTIFRKFTDYLSFLVIAPVLLLAAGSATVMVSSYLKQVAAAHAALEQMGRPLIEFGMLCVPYALSWALFTFVYIFLPNTRVRFGAALFGGLIAGSVYQLLQGGYLYVQMALSRYNVIYGSFSALPLFLIWMYLSWIVVLYGVTLAWLFQNFDYESKQARDELLTAAEKRLLAVLLAAETAHDFDQELPPPSELELARRCRLSGSLTRELLSRLVDRKILTPVASEEYNAVCYQPALPLGKMTVAEVLTRLDEFYVKHSDRQLTSPLLGHLENAMRELHDHMEHSECNRPLTEFFTYCETPADNSSATANGAF